MCASEFQVVKDAVAGRREVDEKVLVAAAKLEERLNRVRALGGKFCSIGFSDPVAELIRQSKDLATVS